MKKEFAPAFPVNVAYDSQGKIRGLQTGNDTGMEIGLTKREYFAGLAMQGMAANSHDAMFMMKAAQIATTSVQLADALLAELEK